MLKGISPVLSPELLKILCEMGHGDEIVLADAHFPGHSSKTRVLRADGLTITALLHGILPLFELDSYSPSLVMMDATQNDVLDPAVESDYMQAIRKYAPQAPSPVRIERHKFYARVESAFAVVMTSELRKYGNLILKKGVTPVSLEND
ncbi:MAG TPA: L-fucose mutarotase [Terracidiphilus sp.]|jgi:L-fucose mutarotase